VLVLGEQVTPLMLGAFATILVGSVLATRTGQRKAGQQTTEPAVAGDNMFPAPQAVPAGREPGKPVPARD
jgi:hypothetical protein